MKMVFISDHMADSSLMVLFTVEPSGILKILVVVLMILSPDIAALVL